MLRMIKGSMMERVSRVHFDRREVRREIGGGNIHK